MTALSELVEPALEKPPVAAQVGEKRVQTESITAIHASSLYRHLDVGELFNEFWARLCQPLPGVHISLENPGLELSLDTAELDTSDTSCVVPSRSFILRYPLAFEEQSLGVLVVRRDHQFLSSEIKKANFLVESFCGPLNNALKYLRVWQSAYHDALTGVRNRASLDLLLSGAEQAHSVHSMLVCDVDSFKLINDQYGHATGDHVLCEFARLLTVQAGCEGSVYRYGGDEFVIAFRRSAADGGLHRADAIRRAVQDLTVVTDCHRISITTTIGLTKVNRAEALDESFLRADSALLMGKRQGKNVVVQF